MHREARLCIAHDIYERVLRASRWENSRAARKFAFPDTVGPTPPIIAGHKVRSNVRHPHGQSLALSTPNWEKALSLSLLSAIRLFLLSFISPSLLFLLFSSICGERPTIAITEERGSGYEGESTRASSQIFNGYRFLMDPARHVWLPRRDYGGREHCCVNGERSGRSTANISRANSTSW